jgi:oligopeptide transport system substrate-binding protein
VKIDNADWAVFYADVLAGNYQLCAMGWSADYLHPMTFLPLAKTDDANNVAFWSNPEYDALVEKVQLCTDPSEAIEYIKAADELVGDNYVFLNLYYKNGTSLMHPYVQGVYINASQMMYLKTASVNK